MYYLIRLIRKDDEDYCQAYILKDTNISIDDLCDFIRARMHRGIRVEVSQGGDLGLKFIDIEQLERILKKTTVKTIKYYLEMYGNKRYKVTMVKIDNPSEKKEICEFATSASIATLKANIDNPGYLCSEVILIK